MNKDLSKEFAKIEASEFPHFYDFDKPLEKSLWVLWVAKEKLNNHKLTAKEIATIIRDVMEISINARTVTNSLNRAGEKIHPYPEGEEVLYEIMKPGKEHLLSQEEVGAINLYYFEPGAHFTSKRLLSKNILNDLQGELRIVDQYCNVRTLDILCNIENQKVKFITRTQHMNRKARKKFFRALSDFNAEYSNIIFKEYPKSQLHDRYILSNRKLILLGHSMKDLGSKESFAVTLTKEKNRNIYEAILENFKEKWRQSRTLN